MNVTQETVAANKLKLTIEISCEEFEESMREAYKKMVKTINIPGFRKGKAPRKIVENYYGEAVFYEEAFNQAFPSAYDKAIEENSLFPVEQPEIDIVQIGGSEPTIFTAEFFVRPEITLGKYKGVEAYKPSHSVTDDEIEAQLKQDQERVSRWVEVERDAKTGDRVTIDYLGKVNDVPFDGGKAEKAPLELGSGSFIPGFEDQVVGMKIGETRDITVTFPEQYNAEELAGKEAVFTITLHEVSEKEVPELDDELAKEVSEFDTLDEYRADIRGKLEKQAEQRVENEFTSNVIDAVCAGVEVEIPQPMIEREIDSMMRDLSMRFAYQGIRLEDFLRYTGQTEEQMRAQYDPQAKNQVKGELVLAAVKKAENIEATEEEVEAVVERYAAQSNQTADEFKKTFTDREWELVRNDAAVQKTIDFLKENAVVTDKAPEPATPEADDSAEKQEQEKPAKPKRAPRAKKAATKTEPAPETKE